MNSPAPLRVLIADDTPDIRALLRLVLERQGDFEVVGEAADGIEAVAGAGASVPDVVVLDLAMPRLDGLQAIPRILASSPTTKIVVLSGFESSVMAAEALSRGAHAYLTKGTPATVIAAKLRQVCGARAESRPDDSGEAADEPPSALSTLVHELRNQLTIVEGFTDTLLMRWEVLTDVQRRGYLERVSRNAEQMRALLDVLSDVHHVDARPLSLDLRSASLATLVSDTVGDVAVPSGRGIDVRIEEDVEVKADPVRFRQVLTNLLSNAVKFSPDGSPITVTVRACEGDGEVRVADCGPGISPGWRGALFRPFARLDATEPGTGLGLYISRGIVASHGGTLTLEDSDQGACFVVRLPAIAPETP